MHDSLLRKTTAGVTLDRLPGLAALPGFAHAFSERTGGVSVGPYESLNVSLGVGDQPAAVIENRRRLARALDVPLERFVLAEQVHGAQVATVRASDVGRGSLEQADRMPSCDALITDVPGLVLLVLSADCVPVVLIDPVQRAVGVVHAGRRGTLAGVVRETVRAMGTNFSSAPRDIHAGLGPSIGPNEYEVGRDVAAEVRAALPHWRDVLRETNGRTTMDLWTANVRQLTDAGVPASNIERSACSTYVHEDRFYSYRRQTQRGAKSGIFGTAVWLTNTQ